MRAAHPLVLLPVLLLAAGCNGLPEQQARVVSLAVVEPADDWGPVTVTPAGASQPVTLSQEGVSVEGVGSSR